ncbi:MAG: FAD:protein FMN transferase [Acidobacteriota bacterium]
MMPTPPPSPSCVSLHVPESRTAPPVARRLAGRLPLALILFAPILLASPSQGAEPVRLAMPAFGADAQVEVRGLPRAQAQEAVRKALLEIHAIEQLTDPSSALGGGVGEVERRIASGEKAGVPVDPRTFALLRRGMQFCLWSSGAFGPLGGGVYDLWREGLPATLDLRAALEHSRCSLLQLATDGASDPAPRAALPVESSFDLRGMAVGFAVDRAVDVLLRAGVGNAFVEIGNVVRAVGVGPDGRGWPVSVPGARGTRHPLDRVMLHNQSMAFIHAAQEEVRSAPRWLDLRTGVPSRGVVLIAAVSELAIDTEALVATLFVVGHSQGQLLLGQLDPRPSVLWLLGENNGAPLESRYHWAALARPR